MEKVPTLDVPMWGRLQHGWTFLCGLPSGGMAVLAKETEQVVLLDPELRPIRAVAIPGLRSVWSPGVSVSEEAGLVAVSFDDGLLAYNMDGEQVFRLAHRGWGVSSGSAWTSVGGLLWAVVPARDPTVDDVVAINVKTWTLAGRVSVHAPSRNQACYWLMPSPAGDQVIVCGALADSDGYYLSWPRWDGEAVVAPADPLLGYCLSDVRSDGSEFLAVTDGDPNELVLFDLAAGSPATWLDMSELAEGEDTDDSWDISACYLSGDHLLAPTRECHLLLLHRKPLRVVAELNLEGYWFSPFSGCSIDTRGMGGDHPPFLGTVQRWTGRRLVVSHSENGTQVTQIYDLNRARPSQLH